MNEEAMWKANALPTGETMSELKPLKIEYPQNFDNWPRTWRSCFEDGIEAYKKALIDSGRHPDPIIVELAEALERNHFAYTVMANSSMETGRSEMERHQDMFPDCPTCALIRRAKGE
jgi:hypothetical protein